MKDLKHLIYFEDLLQDAQNELVNKAKAQGRYALGYNCYYVPEVLLNLPGCFSSRLRAPRCTSTDIAGYYMTNRTCPYARSILERAIEGGFNYLDALFGAESCATMDRMEQHFFLINPVKNDRFFVTQIDPPMKGDKTNLEYYEGQLNLADLSNFKEAKGITSGDNKNMNYLRSIFMEKNKEALKLIAVEKKKWEKHQFSKNDAANDSLYQAAATKIRQRDDLHPPIVMIKPTGRASYSDVVAILDEMQINNISRFQIETLSKDDSTALAKRGVVLPPVGK